MKTTNSAELFSKQPEINTEDPKNTQIVKYYVIGGQYERYNYGGTETVEGAKRLAAASLEYWDNHEGWHKPLIYRAEDCEEYENSFGLDFYPKDFTDPYMMWSYRKKRWVKFAP